MSYTTHSAKQRTGLYRRFSGCLPRFVATVWRVYPAILHRLRHVRAHTRAQMHYTDTRYQRHAGRCTAQHSRPIIIRYIRVQQCAPVIDPCQTVQHTADHASPAGSAPAVCGSLASAAPAEGSTSRCFQRPAACSLAPVSNQGAPAGTLHPAGQSSSRSAAGGAEPLAACAAALFGLSPDS